MSDLPDSAAPPGEEQVQQAETTETPAPATEVLLGEKIIKNSAALPDQAPGAEKQPEQQDEAGGGHSEIDFATAQAQAAALAAKFSGDSSKRKFDDGDANGPDAKRMNTDANGSQTEANASGDVTHTFYLPPEKVGRIIGRAGSTIKEIQARTGTRVQVEHSAEGVQRPVHLIGPAAAVEACKALVNDVMENDNALASAGDVTKHVDCPQNVVGRIIGRGGETIRSLQSGSGAYIMVDQNFPPEVPRKVIISGRPDAVDRAFRMVNELIGGDPGSAQQIIQKVLSSYGIGTSKTVECPKSVVGRVIGKGGETIKNLQKNFGASVQIDQSGSPCRITVAGPTQAALACERAILDIIEDRGGPQGMGMPPGMPGGFPGTPPFNPMFSTPPFDSAAYGGYGAPFTSAAPYAGYGGYGAPAGPAYPAFGGAPPFAPPAYNAPAAAAAYPGYPTPVADPYAVYNNTAGAAAPPAAVPAASVWQELRDDQGRPYYYNSQTGQSQWEKPADMA